MKERTRNLLVGLTVIVALVILGGMIIQFQELPGFLQRGYTVRMTFPNASGAREGTDVYLAGVRIGRVIGVSFTDDGDPGKGVIFSTVIDRDVNIPASVNAYVRPRGFMGGTMVELVSDGQPPGAQRLDASGRPLRYLPKDDSLVVLGSQSDAGGGLLPPDLLNEARDSMKSLKHLADQFSSFMTPPTTTPASATATQPYPIANLHVTLAKLEQALDGLNKLLGDTENTANLKTALANLKTMTASAMELLEQGKGVVAKASGAFDGISSATRAVTTQVTDLMPRLVKDADALGELLGEFNRVLVKLDRGDGSAGKLLNDPGLYNNIFDLTQQLKVAMSSLQELLESWKKEGVKMKLR